MGARQRLRHELGTRGVGRARADLQARARLASKSDWLDVVASDPGALLDIARESSDPDTKRRVALLLPRAAASSEDRRAAAEVLEGYLRSPLRSVQANALEGLADLALREPDGRARALTLLRAALGSAVPAVAARARVLIERLETIPRDATRRS